MIGWHICFPSPFERVETDILGAVAAAAGTLRAVEALKQLLGLGESLSGSLTVYDGLSATFRKLKLHLDPACALCGAQASLKNLANHQAA